jgi:hypothetical protein
MGLDDCGEIMPAAQYGQMLRLSPVSSWARVQNLLSVIRVGHVRVPRIPDPYQKALASWHDC